MTNSVAGLQSSNAQNTAQDNLTQQGQQNQYAASLYGDQNAAQTGQLNSLEGYNSAQTAADQIGASEENQSSQTSGSVVTGVLGAAAGLLSDQRAKESVHDGSSMADDFLRHVDPKGYEYRQDAPTSQAGEQLGVMAQDLEKTRGIGSSLVSQGADGYKRVNGAPTLSAALAGLGRLP